MNNSTTSFDSYKESYKHLVEILDAIQGIYKDLYNTKFAAKYEGSLNGVTSIQLIEQDEDYKKKYIERLIYDTIYEFMNFTDTSLFASSTRKHSVAFALLRKPFRDILDTWLFLVIDPDFFVENLFKNPKKVDVSSYKVRAELKQKINDTPDLFERGFDDYQYSIAYTLRYSTENQLTMSKLMTQANHLLTTSKNQESDEGTLNFIHFTTMHDDALWKVYYSTLYALLLHASHLLIILIEKHTLNFHSDNLEKLYKLTWRIEKVFE